MATSSNGSGTSATVRAPAINSTEAPRFAINALRTRIEQINGQATPDAELKYLLVYVADVLNHVASPPELKEVSLVEYGTEMSDDFVNWITQAWSLPSRRDSNDIARRRHPKRPYRTDSMLTTTCKELQKLLTNRPTIQKYIDENAHSWTFDPWYLKLITWDKPLVCLGHKLFQQYDFMTMLQIDDDLLYQFLAEIESFYMKDPQPNDYHNNVHAADVTQAMHVLLSETELKDWLSDVEVLACYLAAIVHDVNHTGTTNEFHVQTRSELALLYHDRSVLEHHHIATTFEVLKQEDKNILKNLQEEEYKTVRKLVIEMVLATDMASHSSHQTRFGTASAMVKPEKLLEFKVPILCYCLHWCDISHPMRQYKTHEKFTERLYDESRKQGIMQEALGFKASFLCDAKARDDMPRTQIGFITEIVQPSFITLKDLVNVIIPLISTKASLESKDQQADKALAEQQRLKELARQEEQKQKRENFFATVSDFCGKNIETWKVKLEEQRKAKEKLKAEAEQAAVASANV